MNIKIIAAITLVVIIIVVIIIVVMLANIIRKESYIDNLEEVKGSVTGVIQLGSHECSEATDKHVGSNYIWIEAIPSVQEKCQINASQFGQKSIQGLLWNKTGEKKKFHIYNDAQSSSVFQMNQLDDLRI